VFIGADSWLENWGKVGRVNDGGLTVFALRGYGVTRQRLLTKSWTAKSFFDVIATAQMREMLQAECRLEFEAQHWPLNHGQQS
jgi:hypothetical protein